MSALTIRLFGKFDVQCSEQTMPALEPHKVQELLCYLLLHRDHSHPREVLASLLWPDSPAAQSRKCLRQVLWKLRATLDAATSPVNDPLLLVKPDWIQVNPQADFWLDVAAFEQAFALVQEEPGQALKPASVQAVQAAIPLYRGDLLEGWYQEWCLFERERLQSMYLGMLEKLMAYDEACGDYEAGLGYGACILRCDVAHERTHRRLMRLHYLAGNRTAALRQYERCVATLRQELDVGPSASTVVLYEQIRADRPLDQATPEGEDLPTGDARSLPQTLSRLKLLQTAFAEVQCQLQQAILMVETAIGSSC